SGRHEFDGQMPGWDRAALQGDVDGLHAKLAELEKYDASALTPTQQFERDYVHWVIDSQLFWTESAEGPYRNPAWYIDRLDPSMYLTRDYAPLSKRLEGFLGYARAVPALAASIRANLRTPLPRAFIERGTAAFSGYAAFFRTDLPPVFAQLSDEK